MVLLTATAGAKNETHSTKLFLMIIEIVLDKTNSAALKPRTRGQASKLQNQAARQTVPVVDDTPLFLSLQVQFCQLTHKFFQVLLYFSPENNYRL